jgi:hypothetical protein
MNRISSLLALGVLSLGLATSASAQTKVTQLVIQNANGTTKLSHTTGGLDITNKIIIHCPSVPGNSVTLQVPNSVNPLNTTLTFPTEDGTLLTTAPTALNGDAMIAAINEGSGLIDAARLNIDLGSLGGGVTSVDGTLLNNLTFFTNSLTGAVTGQLNLSSNNTWIGNQLVPANQTQGNNLINAINMGNIALTGYATTASLSTYVTLTQLNTAISNVTGGVTTVSGTGTIDFPPTSGASRSDATITVTGAAVGDAVALATPTGLVTANNTTCTAWVSAANTVTVRFSNNGNGGSIDPPSASFKVVVFK